MIQTLWFFVQIGLIVAAAIWLATQPGSVSMSLFDYTFTVQVGVFFLALVLIVGGVLFLSRIVRFIFSAPTMLRKYQEKKNHNKGYRALTRGLVAVAAGDAKKATLFSKQTQSLLSGQNGLPTLLAAQAARLRGEEGLAQNHFKELMKDKDAAFLGIRGLLKSALDEGHIDRALDYARQAEILHPRQGWVLKTVYDLEIQNRLWSDALVTGKKAVKFGAITTTRAISDRVAIHLMRHDYDKKQGNDKSALKELERAYKLNPYFVPTVTRLAEHYIDLNKNRKAASLIEKAWRENPHPELTVIWDKLAPALTEKTKNKRLKWYENLVSFRPDSAEGQMAAARAAMDMDFWGEAKAYLMMAEKIYPSARLFRLRAVVEQNSTHNEDAIHELMEKASDALPDKAWTCRKTGLSYDAWSAIALPHESFNTIIWDYPVARIIQERHHLNDVQETLLIDPLG